LSDREVLELPHVLTTSLGRRHREELEAHAQAVNKS